MRIFWATSLVLFLPATSVMADISDECEAAIAAGDTEAVKDFGEDIRSINWMPLATGKGFEACMSAAEDVQMIYTRFGWETASELEARLAEEGAANANRLAEKAAAEEAVRSRICEIKGLVTQYGRTIDEAEAARQDRRIETLSATVQECSTWFDDSPKEALTNDICNSIFAAGGLPNSTISGPSQSEVLLAELSKQNIETELEILLASGMLIEDFMAQYNSDETEDVYGCGQ